MEEEYITSWEEIHQTRVSSGGGRVEIVNDDPDGSEGTIILGLTGLKFEDEEKRRIPISARIQIPEDFRGELEINTVSGDITLPWFEGESLGDRHSIRRSGRRDDLWSCGRRERVW